MIVAVLTTVAGAISGVMAALWRRIEQLDTRADQLLQENAELRAMVAALKDDLDQERIARDRERIEYRQRIRRLEDENRILRSALRANGIPVEQHTSEE